MKKKQRRANEARLAELMRLAFEDKLVEPDFFRALLDAKVYAHIPKGDPRGRLRMIQFVLPTRQWALPFFSELEQAITAAGRTAQVIAMTGRQLFELTRGATLVLNPNSVSCTLYPEEIAALLDHDEVAIIERLEYSEASMQVEALEQAPSWLLDALVSLCAQLAYVEAAYLAEIHSLSGSGILVVLAVPTENIERAARATTTALQSQCHAHGASSVDVTTFVPGHPPEWLTDLRIEPFYRRDWGKRIMDSTA